MTPQGFDRLKKALETHAPDVLASLGSPADDDALAAAERSLGFALPPAYRAFLAQHDGGEERPSLFGMHFFMPLEQQIEHRSEIDEQMRSEKEDDDECPWTEKFLPFGNEHSWKNLLFVDCAGGGAVWHYWEGDWTERAPDFDTYLADLATKIESGQLVPDEHGRLREPD